MAREFDGSGFWLPSEFLTDDDLLTDFESEGLRTSKLDDFSYSFANSFGFNSDMSSPGDFTSPTQADDEEDYLASEITQKFAHSTLRTSNFSSHYASKGWQLSGSPQSTLCGCEHSSTGSPNSVSGFCSPPDTENYLGRDRLYAAAEEAARMRIIEETASFCASKLLSPQFKRSPIPTAGVYPNQARSQSGISFQLLQAAMQQQQMMKKRVHGARSRVADFQLHNGRIDCGDGRAQRLSMAAWPGLQQPSSGLQAFFLGELGPKKERIGTGVFLPKRFGSVPDDTRKKSGCPTVVLPEVAHELNLDVESIDDHVQPNMVYGNSNFDYGPRDGALKRRNNAMASAQERRNLAAQWAMSQRPSLPQGWTY